MGLAPGRSVSDFPRLTRMPSPYIKPISLYTKTMATLPTLPHRTYLTLTSWLEAFPASRFQSLASGKASLTHEERSSFPLPISSKHVSLHIFSLRTSKAYSITKEGRRSKPSSPHLMSWGMTYSGRCVTARISDSHKTVNGFTFLDIAETNPDPKYFLSKERMQNLLYQKPILTSKSKQVRNKDIL